MQLQFKKKAEGDSSDSAVDNVDDHVEKKDSKDFPLVATIMSEPSNEVPVTKPAATGAGILLKFVGNLKNQVMKLNDTDLKNAKKVISLERDMYENNRWKVWPCTICGLVIGIIIAVASPTLTNKLGTTLYDRSAVDKLMTKFLGGKKVS
jgi:hypothetical protein